MIENKKICLVIPCHNEEKGLAEIFKKDLAAVDRIVVVDNNCRDQTARIARDFGARVVKENIPGYGAAYLAGFQAAEEDIVVTMDGDNTYPVDEIGHLVRILLKNDLDFISADRLSGGKPRNMDMVNYAGNQILTWTTRLLFGKAIRDSQSGMWVFRRSILERIDPRSSGMAFSEEIKIEAISKGIRFAEVPIPYYERWGEVKLNKWKDGFYNLYFLFYKRFFG